MFEGIRRLFRHGGDQPPQFSDDIVVTIEAILDDTFDEFDEALDVIDVDDSEDIVSHERRSEMPSHLLEFWERLSPIGDNAAGTVFGIEYVNASGERSVRRIRFHRLYADGEMYYLRAFCFERGANRTFRLDRVQSVFDMDGVIHDDIQVFFAELGVDAEVPEIEKTTPEPRVEKPGMAARRAARDGLRLLVGLARADGFLHDEEIEVLKQYIAHRAEHDGVFVNDNDLAALDGYLRRQHPSGEVLSRCLEALEAEPANLQRLFVVHAMALADADGVQHGAEFEMLMELQDRLGGQ